MMMENTLQTHLLRNRNEEHQAVDRDFADWYRDAKTEPQDDTLGKRWQGIEAFTENLEYDDIPELARLFHGLRPRRQDMIEAFRECFQGIDSVFPMKGNELELAILAGATLTQATVGEDTAIADFAALAVTCPGFQDARKGAPVLGILGRMRNYLRQRSLALRSSSPLDAAQLPTTFPQQGIDALKEKCVGSELTMLAEPLKAAFEDIGNRVNALAEATNLSRCHQSLYREDSEVLWWLVGKHSRDFAAPMNQIEYPGVCLIVGKEFADLICNLPGPYSAPAVMDSVLCGMDVDLAKPVALSAAVNGTDRTWRQQWLEQFRDSDVLDLCPAMFAVAKSLEVNAKNAWLPAFNSAMRVPAGTKIPPSALATQVYIECLLHKVVPAEEE